MLAKRVDALWQKGRPAVMGILNVTPDSFSDGGVHPSTDAALAHGEAMIAAGADINSSLAGAMRHAKSTASTWKPASNPRGLSPRTGRYRCWGPATGRRGPQSGRPAAWPVRG